MRRLNIIPLILILSLMVTACGNSGDEAIDLRPIDEDRRSDRIDIEPEDETKPRPGPIVGDTDESDGSTSDTIAAAGSHDRAFPELPPDDVEFRDYGENQFTPTGEDDLSTFAIDVDTGSYTIMRQWVGEGLVPPPESVRPEEYVNFFDPGYVAPEDDIFAVYADAAPTPYTDQANDVLLRIGIKGTEVERRERPAVALTFVVDVSGSMEQDGRLELVKDSIATLVGQLGRSDSVAVVAYDDRARVVLEPTPGHARRRVLAAVDELSPGGSTNAEAGILLGYDVAAEGFSPEATNRVILLSDGVANVGEEGPDGILRQIQRQVDQGIALLTVGVGMGNYNDVLMEQLADGADGNYRYVDTIDEAERVFVDELTGTLVTIARDVKVQVDFDRSAVTWYRLVGFENRDVADDDFRDDRVDGGEIGAGHSVTALYQVELAEGVRRGDRLAKVSVRWSDPDRERTDEVVGEVTGEAISESWSDAPPRFRLAATAAALAEELRDGRYSTAYDIFDVSQEADRLAEEIDDPEVWEMADLIHQLVRLEHH